MTGPHPAVAGDRAASAFKRFSSPSGEHVLIVPHSRIFDLPQELAARFDEEDPAAINLAAALATTAEGEESLDLVPDIAPQSLSLNVSSACNLGCSYCYADRGSFNGAQAQTMTAAVATAAIESLFAAADAGRPITVGFLGGEPFLNRDLIHELVAYAAGRGRQRGLDVRFSVTTNGTLLRPDDLDLIRRHPFAVTVSIDGDASVQDAQRPTRGGRGSFEALRRSVGPLLAEPGGARIAARATVTRLNLDLVRSFDAIRALGFCEVGFAPLRSSPSRGVALAGDDWPDYLAALVLLARRELAAAGRGEEIALSNLMIALKQLHRGASAPYPCGAGGGYFSVSAAGRWYACHRAVGDNDYDLGSNHGLDADKRLSFLQRRHVHAQTDCRTCWARYLCSGGCHQEAAHRTGASCDFIRGWLDFCLTAYCELLARRPDFFAAQDSTPLQRSA